MKSALFQTPLFKKIDKVVMYVVIPLLVLCILFYVYCANPVFQLSADYYFTATGIRVTGGNETLAGKGISLWGKYPFVYGRTSEGKPFLLDMEAHKLVIYQDENDVAGAELGRFLRNGGMDFGQCLTWEELMQSGDSKQRQMALKRQLFNPRKTQR